MMCCPKQGGFTCSPCPVGYITNGLTGCILDDPCIAGVDDCDPKALCSRLRRGQYRCEVW